MDVTTSAFTPEPIAQAVWTKLRCIPMVLIFVTPGPMLIPTLNQVLVQTSQIWFWTCMTSVINGTTGWQRPMLQGQTLSIQYKKEKLFWMIG